MTRALSLVMMLLCTCAHTQPVNQASRITLFSAEEPTEGCTGVIKLEGEIGNPEEFVAALKACADRAVVVEINSPGGSVFGALEMEKAIERHPHTVICLVDGLAASAAFSVLQSCGTRLMTDRSVLMVHHAAASGSGHEEQMANVAAALRAIDRGMALHLAKRMGMTPEELESKISGGREWWIGLEEGLSVHAVDAEGGSLADAEKLAAEPSR